MDKNSKIFFNTINICNCFGDGGFAHVSISLIQIIMICCLRPEGDKKLDADMEHYSP
jgi:hypothetical protein